MSEMADINRDVFPQIQSLANITIGLFSDIRFLDNIEH